MNFCAIQKREHNHNDVNGREKRKGSKEATGTGDNDGPARVVAAAAEK